MPKHREGDRLFPFGVATVYGMLKENKYDVNFVDCSLGHDDLNEIVESDEIKRYDIIGIGGLVTAYRTVRHEMSPWIRANAPDALVIAGGYLAVSTYKLLLNRRIADVAFLGDAETSLLAFLRVYDNPGAWQEVRGIAFRNADGTIVDNGMGRVEGLEDSYVPYYKHLDVQKYNTHLPDGKRYYPMVVETGCPFQCAFCFNSSGSHMRTRSPKHVIEEIRIAMERYGYPRVYMMAENLLLRRRWVEEFCSLIHKYGLKFKWRTTGHANALSEELLRLVAAHGCDMIGIGFENFSQKILNNMNKKTEVQAYPRVIAWMRRCNIRFTGTCIFGYFGEDDETVRENIEFIQNNILGPQYFYIQPYPLTTLWTQCVDRGLITDEEEFIERLGDAKDFVINLTDLPDEEYHRLRAQLDEASRNAIKVTPAMLRKALRLYGAGWVWFEFKDLVCARLGLTK